MRQGEGRKKEEKEGEKNQEEVKRREKQVFWLNPEPPSRWNSGDAIMARYQPYCRAARRCSTLNDLSRFTDFLLKSV